MTTETLEASSASTPAPRRREDTRERLIRAGLVVLDHLPLSKVLAAGTTSAVAERAGVTTGSFFHHFATAAEFADAIALSHLERPADVEAAIEAIRSALPEVDLFDLMRSNMDDTWQVFQREDLLRSRFRLQMQLWAHQHKALSKPAGDLHTAGDILRAEHRARHEEATRIWSRVLERSGRKPTAPFTVERLATALTALFQGLLLQREMEPDLVDDALFADAAIALANAVTAPLGSRLRLSDVGSILDESRLSPQARSGARRRRDTRAKIRDAAVDLFDDGWEPVSLSDVAEASGVSHQTVINLFGTVRSVAAACFARHVGAIRAVAVGDESPDEPGDHPDDMVAEPVRTLRATLIRLAECASADPQLARALISERLETQQSRGGELREYDIRIEVPLAEALLHPLERMDLDGREPVAIATTLINFVLMQSVATPDRARETADLAMCLVPGIAAPSTAAAG